MSHTAQLDECEFTHYLAAWSYCMKAGLSPACIKRISYHLYKVVV